MVLWASIMMVGIRVDHLTIVLWLLKLLLIRVMLVCILWILMVRILQLVHCVAGVLLLLQVGPILIIEETLAVDMWRELHV